MSQSVLVESPVDKLSYISNVYNDKLHCVLSEEYRSQGNFISVFINEYEDVYSGPLNVSVNDDMYQFEFKEETPQFTKYYYKCEWENDTKCNNLTFNHIDYVEIKVKKGDKVDVEISNYSLIQIPNNIEEDGLEEYIFEYTEEGIYVSDGPSSNNNIKYFYPKGTNTLEEYEMIVEVGDLP
jgi:translation initiation factor IF-1